MSLASPEVRAAKVLLAKHRKDQRAARPAKVVPTAPGQRQPRKREPKYLQWLRRLPCAAAGAGDCEGPTEAAHLRYSSAASGRRNPGMQSKPDDRHATPLCVGHHRGGALSQHSMNEARFWSIVGIDPAKLCIALGECYDNNGDGAAVIHRFTQQASARSRWSGL